MSGKGDRPRHNPSVYAREWTRIFGHRTKEPDVVFGIVEEDDDSDHFRICPWCGACFSQDNLHLCSDSSDDGVLPYGPHGVVI
jgi:hypothetical protein